MFEFTAGRFARARRVNLCLALAMLAVSATPLTALDRAIVGEDGTILGPRSDVVRSVVYSSTASGVPTLNVAIVASASNDIADPFFTDPQNRLVASGLFASVTVINAALVTPSPAELQAFDAVLVWSNFAFADRVTLGNRLADYVDDGGGVVLAVFANSSNTLGRALGGRWDIAQYGIIPQEGGNASGTATLGTVHDGLHPIMNGVSSFAGGTSSFRPVETSLVPSATLIAEWSDGSTLVAVREDTIGARAALGFYPPSDIVLPNFWDATTGGGTLLANALLYAASRIPLNLGDSDDDGDVDAEDFAAFDSCVNPDSSVFALAGCIVFDLDGDKNVDCADWQAFGDIWTDPGQPPLSAACFDVLPATSTWGFVALALAVLSAGSILEIRRACLSR